MYLSYLNRSQMIVHLKASGFIRPRGAGDMRDLNTNSNNWAVVKVSFTQGTFISPLSY